MTKKKIKSLIISIILLITLNLSLIYTDQVNTWAYSTLERNFNVVSSVGNLEVHFISVGNGDAIAINLPDGKSMLIDTGTTFYSKHYTNYIKQKVLPFDKDYKIDWLVLSHADADHIGGTVRLLDEVAVDYVYTPLLPSASNSTTYADSMAAINSKTNHSKIDFDMVLEGENYKFNFFGPVNTTDTNNSCPLIKLEYMNKSFLFTGDIEEDAEHQFVAMYPESINSDVLKVGHHGSKTSTSLEFLQEVSPDISVISVGKNNRYHHPDSLTLEKLESANSKIYRTDTDGDIMIILGDNYNLNVKTNNYTIINFVFDYRIILFAVDGIIVLQLVVTLVKKEKPKKLKKY